jgi:hypothetical protein
MAAILYNDFMFLGRFSYMYRSLLFVLIFIVTIFHSCYHYLTDVNQIG